MALNIKDNQRLDLVFRDGHTERVIDGFCAMAPYSIYVKECIIKTTHGLYKLVTTYKLRPSNDLNNPIPVSYTEEEWYKYNEKLDQHEEIEKVGYYLYTDEEEENEQPNI